MFALIKELNELGRPVLVGTTSIEKSERVSTILKRQGVKHVVLNAKYHEKEAEIIAQAGAKGAVTIATNMAGRGTDIILGGNPEFQARVKLRTRNLNFEDNVEEHRREVEKLLPEWKKQHDEVVSLEGLHIIGTERHESRRVDNQLRGRSGRQGDPGSSRFYLSLEDDLMRIFGSENISGIMQKLGMEEGIPIESKLITRQIERAQKQIEARNFEIRKHLLEYDDVMNKQREEIYRFRRELLEEHDQKNYILQLAEDLLIEFLESYTNQDIDPEQWDLDNLKINLNRAYGMDLPIDAVQLSRPELEEKLVEQIRSRYREKEEQIGSETMRWYERMVMLQLIDQQWKDHLLALDHLKEGIGLRGYGQRDPLIEYKRESFQLFEDLWNRATDEMVRMLFFLQPISEEEGWKSADAKVSQSEKFSYSGGSDESPSNIRISNQPIGDRAVTEVKTVVRSTPKTGRNDPCICGSGKKFKKCCGR